MAELMRARVVLGGSAVVGGGVATFHAATSDQAAFKGALEDFYSPLVQNMPTSLSITIPAVGEMIDVESGDITGSWSDGSPTVLSGGDPGGFALGVGARVVWNTDARTNGRRVRGSTFLVPMSNGAWETNGTILAIILQRIGDAAAALMAGLGSEVLTVYTRPRDATPGKGSAVVSYAVPDKISWLRSRRT